MASFRRIVAIDDVHLEAPPGTDEALRWFYGELAGLEEPLIEAGAHALCFRSERLRLWLHLRSAPRVDSMACRVVLLVPRLVTVAQMLVENHVAYQPLSGLTYTDRRLSLHDPAGNRVEFKQAWPFATL